MKIAVCISGQPRNVERGIKILLHNIIDEFDVFVHAWWDSKSAETLFTKSNAAKLNDVVSEPVDNTWIDMLYKKYNVKKINLESQIDFKVSENLLKRKTKYSNAFNIHSGMYSIYKCNELKKQYELENNFKYDWVIRIRFDFGFDKLIEFNEYDNNCIYVPNDCEHNFGFNDQFAIGSSKNMDTYSDLYLKIDEVLNSYNNNIKTTNYCPTVDLVGHEQLLQQHLENNNLSYKIINFNNFLYRHNGKPDRETGYGIHSIIN